MNLRDLFHNIGLFLKLKYLLSHKHSDDILYSVYSANICENMDSNLYIKNSLGTQGVAKLCVSGLPNMQKFTKEWEHLHCSNVDKHKVDVHRNNLERSLNLDHELAYTVSQIRV